MRARDDAELQARIIRLDGKLSPGSVDQRRKTDDAGPPEVGKQIERSPHRAASEHNIIDHHGRLVIELDLELRWSHHRARADFGKIVPIEGDVEDAAAQLRVTGC